MKLIKDSDSEQSFTNLLVHDKTTSVVHNLHIKIMNTVELELTGFALVQLIEGASLVMTKPGGSNINAINLLFKVVKHEIEVSHCESPKNLIYNSHELNMFRKWIEARLRHCEDEKFLHNPKFNADTYVSLKFLLLDIRELLLGEIIEINA